MINIIKKVTGLFGLSVIISLLLWGKNVNAAFPADMEQRPVLAHSVDYGTVSVYKDADLTKECGQVDGGRLQLTAYKVKDNAIFGDYSSGDAKGSGWFSMETFVEDPSYKNVYATARDGMYAYTDSSFDEVRGTIKKYTGIIVISKEGSNRQIIFETEDGYEIGWMTAGAFSNCLVYDGRDKQILADGEYRFSCGYQDDETGGAAMKNQTALADYSTFTFVVTYVSEGNYYLMDKNTGKYLSVKLSEENSGSESHQQGSAAYIPCWVEKPDEVLGQFRLSRICGSFVLQNTRCHLFLGQDEEKNLILTESRLEDSTHWRASALEKIVPTGNPMVFTQYDPQWCATPYGGGGCMGTAGCGVLATVNAVYALSGQYMGVMELADYAVEKNYRIVGSGTDDGIFKAACKKFGKKYNFAWDGSSGSIDVLKKKLKAGDTAVVHVQGHYVAIATYSKKKNKYLLLDSNYLPKRATSAFGDWISVDKLLSGSLEAQCFYFFKLRDV